MIRAHTFVYTLPDEPGTAGVLWGGRKTWALARVPRGSPRRHVSAVSTDFQFTRRLTGCTHSRDTGACSLPKYPEYGADEPSKAEVDDVLERLFPATKSARAELQRSRVKNLWVGHGIGADMKGVEGTSWGLYNALTELTDHYANEGSKRADADDMRLNAMWFGSGATFKQTCLNTLADVCLK